MTMVGGVKPPCNPARAAYRPHQVTWCCIHKLSIKSGEGQYHARSADKEISSAVVVDVAQHRH
jgi:hypothetical protein